MHGGVLVLGSSNMDLVMRGARLPAPGETVLASGYQQHFGGKGANQAVAARRAGAEVGLLAGLGDDVFGRDTLEHLRAEGIDLEHAKIVKASPTGVAFILLDADGQNMIAVHPGANAEFSAADIKALPDEVFTKRRIFVTQLETPLPTVTAGLKRARRADLVTLLNPAPAVKLSTDLLREVDLLVPNESEATALTGQPVTGVREARQAARALLELTRCAVIITLGDQGSLAAWRRDDGGGDSMVFDEHVPAQPVKAVDSVAAGDAFIGGLAASLARHLKAGGTWQGHLLSAMQFATRGAALAVTRAGAQASLPTFDEIKAFKPH